MTSPQSREARSKPLLVHVTTTDISLSLLLGPQLRAFAEAGFDVVGISGPGPFVEEVQRLGVRHIPLRHATRSVSLRSDVLAFWELQAILRALRPDIVHTHNPKPGIYGRFAAALVRVPAVVNTVHGLYATDEDGVGRRTAVYTAERIAAAFSDAELVQNPEDLSKLRQLHVPPARLHLLGNGVDLARFSRGPQYTLWRSQLRAELGATTDTVIVTAVGRLVWEKGYAALFEAAREVLSLHDQAMFVIAGPLEPTKADGISKADLDAARRSGVHILGYTPDIERVYAASDIYVLASHREGFPRSAMEAAAMGLPIVATNIRGCRQVVEDGRTGYLVPPRDPVAMARAISELVSDANVRERMGESAVSKARKEFDQTAVIRRTLEIYRDLLDRDAATKHRY